MVQKSQTTTWDGAKTLWIMGWSLPFPQLVSLPDFFQPSAVSSIRFFNEQIVGKKKTARLLAAPWGGANSAYNSCTLVKNAKRESGSSMSQKKKGKAVGCWPKSKFPRNAGVKVGFSEIFDISVVFFENFGSNMSKILKSTWVILYQFWIILK